MSSQATHSTVPRTMAHEQFLEYIGSFPGLQTGLSFQKRSENLRDTIRHQLVTFDPQTIKRKQLIRQCFKFPEKKYVQFCLQNKIPNLTIQQAASQMGYRK